jgi:hypothetical protein
VSIFAGFPVPRMFDRWRPRPNGGAVIRVDRPDASDAISRVRRVLTSLQ